MWLSLNGMSSPSIRRAPVLGEHVGYRLIGVGDQVPVDAQRPRVARLCTWQPHRTASGRFLAVTAAHLSISTGSAGRPVERIRHKGRRVLVGESRRGQTPGHQPVTGRFAADLFSALWADQGALWSC